MPAPPPPKSGQQVHSRCHPPPLQGSTLPRHNFPQRKGKKAAPAHSSARGRPQSGLTLLRVGLRIRLTRSRIQQLFQLQSQGLRPRHGHQVTVVAALVNVQPRAPSSSPGAPAGHYTTRQAETFGAGAWLPDRQLPGGARRRGGASRHHRRC